MNNFPNQVEVLTNSIKTMDDQIHQAHVDKDKLELTIKHFKKVTDVKTKMDYQSKILRLDNQL